MRRKLLVLVCALGFVAAACGGGGTSTGGTKAQPEAQADPNATIRIAATEDRWPENGTGVKSTHFMYPFSMYVYESLLYLGSDYSVKPGLAERWELQPDGKTWRFFLRHGVTFHDGTPFTADDVVWTWGQRQAEGRTLGTAAQTLHPGQTDFNPDAVKKVDDYTVDFTPINVNNRLPEQLVHPEGAIVKKGTNNDTPPYAGTGPFKVVSYTEKQTAVFERNDNYWGDKAKVKRVEMRFIPDPVARLQALKSGQVDFIFDLPPDATKSLETDPNFRVVKSAPGLVHLIYINRLPGRITADRSIREAISYALDRQAYVNVVLEGQGEPGQYTGPKNVLGSYAGQVAPIPRDLGRARRVLDDAGWKVGPDGIRAKGDQRLKVVLLGSPPAQIPESSVAVIQANLKDAGFDVEIKKPPDAATRIQIYNQGRGDFDLALEAPNQTDANPAFLPVLRFWSKSITPSVQFNPGPDYDELAEKAATAKTTTEVQQLSAQMMKILLNQEYTAASMAGVYRIYGMSKNVTFGDPHPSQVDQSWVSLAVTPTK